MLVPGSGEPNFDSYVADPYQRARARQEQEVHQLMDKLQPDMIVLDPTTIGQVSCCLCSLLCGAWGSWHESLLSSVATLACLAADHACANNNAGHERWGLGYAWRCVQLMLSGTVHLVLQQPGVDWHGTQSCWRMHCTLLKLSSCQVCQEANICGNLRCLYVYCADTQGAQRSAAGAAAAGG